MWVFKFPNINLKKKTLHGATYDQGLLIDLNEIKMGVIIAFWWYFYITFNVNMMFSVIKIIIVKKRPTIFLKISAWNKIL